MTVTAVDERLLLEIIEGLGPDTFKGVTRKVTIPVSEVRSLATELEAARKEIAGLREAAVVVPVSWIANCCNCGRIVDTREKADGGDPFGGQMDDGRWTCSFACWDAACGPAAPKPEKTPAASPPPASPSAPQGVEVKPLKWNVFEARSAVGEYRVSGLPRSDGLYGAWYEAFVVGVEFASVDAAKAAAFADYRARILSAIQTSPEAGR